MKLKVGFVANPWAGMGGPAGLKGTDGIAIVTQAKALGIESKVQARVMACLDILRECQSDIELFTINGPMGEDICRASGWRATIIAMPFVDPSRAEDTKLAVKLLQAEGVDLLLFAGGDGTARDVHDVLSEGQLVLGIPCGVKMHSGVFANNPSSAASLINKLTKGEAIKTRKAEIRDIDEVAFRDGKVRAKYYGEVWIPDEQDFVQQVKAGGVQVEALVLDDIAAFITDLMEDDCCYIMGSGSTTAAIMESLGIENTLLGVDVIKNHQLLLADVSEPELFNFLQDNLCQLVLTVIGGQGHLFGRGNQQLSARVIKHLGLDNIHVVATKQKLANLNNRLLLDTGDASLDSRLAGFVKVITGFDDYLLCRLSP